MQDYIRIQEVAKDGIYDEELRFRDKKQAVDALAIGLKGERDLLNHNVSMQLILEIGFHKNARYFTNIPIYSKLWGRTCFK